MELKTDHELIAAARQGDQAALGQLADAVQPPVRAYLLRLTLNHTLADDLVQETLLEMVKSIENLREPDGFWAWIYRVAMSKFQTHYRREKVRRTGEQTLQRHFTEHVVAEQGRDGLARLLDTELSRNILSAIERLDPRDRAVLSLRCFDDLAYGDIAQAMETTEPHARILFFRAKKALKKELVRQGLKGSSLVMALGFFGSLTDTAGAAATGSGMVTVSTAAVKVPLITVITAVCGTKVACLGATALITATALLSAAGVVHTVHTRRTALPPRQDVVSFHFTAQSRNNTPGTEDSLSKGAYEQWYYFPDGIEGAFFMRMQRWDPTQQHRQCAWIQNGQANYYWHAGQNAVYMNNHRLWRRTRMDILVRRLPTDEPELTAFLDRLEGVEQGLETIYDRRTGLPAETVDYRFADAWGFTDRYRYNTVEAAMFEIPWTDARLVDQRDPMRRRGWTYFTIEGTLNGHPLQGRGRLPFFYDPALTHPAWLAIDLPDGGRIVDTPDGAAVVDADGSVRAHYPAGRFFKGLLRPWMGMHTIDCIRRDAASAGIEFSTNQRSNFHRTGSADDYNADVQVACTTTIRGRRAQLRYWVAMREDLLRAVEIEVEGPGDQRLAMSMVFTFYQHLPEAADFQMPVLEPTGQPPHSADGPVWLIDLAREAL